MLFLTVLSSCSQSPSRENLRLTCMRGSWKAATICSTTLSNRTILLLWHWSPDNGWDWWRSSGGVMSDYNWTSLLNNVCSWWGRDPFAPLLFFPPPPSILDNYHSLKIPCPTCFPLCAFLSSLHSKSLIHQSSISQPSSPGIRTRMPTHYLIRYTFLLKTQWSNFINLIAQHLTAQLKPYWHACPQKEPFVTPTKSIKNQVLDPHTVWDKMPSPGGGLWREWAILSQHPTH